MELENNHPMKMQWQMFCVQQNQKMQVLMFIETQKIDATFVESPHDDLIGKFHHSDNGLCFHDPWDDKLILTKDKFNAILVN